MFDKEHLGWLLGRPSFNGGAVGWAGIVILPNFIARVDTAADAETALCEQGIGHIKFLCCTASENLIAALTCDGVRRIAPKILDLSLAARIAFSREAQEGGSKRTVDLLAENMSLGRNVTIPQPLRVSLLEGRVGDDDVRDLTAVNVSLRSLLSVIGQQLRKAGELRRYAHYELPAHRVLLAQSRFRLLVDSEGLVSISDELAAALREGRVKLVTEHAQDPMDLIRSFEARREFAAQHLGSGGDRLTIGEFRELLEERDKVQSTSGTARQVSSYLKDHAANLSLASLVKADAAGCPVEYDSIGTSTGRIVMRTPGVQWLEKKYRKYILPPEDYQLLYLDYACFEPSILAAVSGDAELLNACRFDVYERVGEWLGFDGACARDIAKSSLLRFIYGQSQDKLVATLCAVAQLEDLDARTRLKELERRFVRAFEFRSRLTEKARSSGYMETHVGNRCHIEKGEEFKALSHYLQGTGALIFKRALVGIFEGNSAARLVVPMHDAFLCAFPTDDLDRYTRQAIAAMQTAFSGVVGVDLARISVRRGF